MKFFVGTSGWSYRHWQKRFYPPDLKTSDWLGYYAHNFPTVEINNTFYHLPSEKAVRRWQRITPPSFVFAVKASRYLTHIKRLRAPVESLKRFLAVVSPLGKKLGPILFQLPPGFKRDLERLESFLEGLPPQYRYAVEFRHPSWYVGEVDALLKKFNVAFCIHDFAGKFTPFKLTADFTYLRFHGPKGRYRGSYSTQTLQHWAEILDSLPSRIKVVYCYFNNDERAYAVKNARQLKEFLRDG